MHRVALPRSKQRLCASHTASWASYRLYPAFFLMFSFTASISGDKASTAGSNSGRNWFLMRSAIITPNASRYCVTERTAENLSPLEPGIAIAPDFSPSFITEITFSSPFVTESSHTSNFSRQEITCRGFNISLSCNSDNTYSLNSDISGTPVFLSNSSNSRSLSPCSQNR